MAPLIQIAVLLTAVGFTTASHNGCEACMIRTYCPSLFYGLSKHQVYNAIHHHGNYGLVGRRTNDEAESLTRRQQCTGPWAIRGHCYNFLGEEESGWLTISLRDIYNRQMRVWVKESDIHWKCPQHHTHAHIIEHVHETHAPTTPRATTHAVTTPVTKAPTTSTKLPTTTTRPTTPTPTTTHAPVTHIVTMTTTQPSTTTETCVDLVDCDAYGKDYICSQYPEAAKVTCRKSCSYC